MQVVAMLLYYGRMPCSIMIPPNMGSYEIIIIATHMVRSMDYNLAMEQLILILQVALY